METEYLMRQAFKYEILRDALFDNSKISEWLGDLRFDNDKVVKYDAAKLELN